VVRLLRVKRIVELFAMGATVAQWAQIPLLILAFLLLTQVTRVAHSMGVDLESPHSLWFLKGQYAFLSNRGLISPRVVAALHMFECFACLSIIIGILCLISVLGTFALDWRAIVARRKKQNVSTFKLIAGWLLVGPGGIWGSLDIDGWFRTLLKPIFFSSPVFLVGLEACCFIFGTIAIVWGLLGCILAFLSSMSELPTVR
jgi:hypothetical protein